MHFLLSSGLVVMEIHLLQPSCCELTFYAVVFEMVKPKASLS